MPVTAKLSRKFYERLGDDIANELVDWFNAVDDTYRTQLRDLNELNWNRFQAAMDARFAEFEGKMDRRFAEVDAKMDRKFAEVDVRFSSFEAKIERRFTENTRWMLGFWLATVIPLGGLMVGLFNSVR
jgi:hypothetical protein